MGKIKKKIIKVLVTVGLISSLSLGVFAGVVPEKTQINLEYKFENKDFQKLINNEIDYKSENFSLNYSPFIKEMIFYFAILNNMFQKYGLPKEEILNVIPTMNSDSEELKGNELSGKLRMLVENSNLEKFKNLIRDFNTNIQNIEITPEAFNTAKTDLTNMVEVLLKLVLKEFNKATSDQSSPEKGIFNVDATTEILVKQLKDAITKVEYNNDVLSEIKRTLRINEIG